MKRLNKTNVCHVFSRHQEPALRVKPGEAFCLETEDAYSGSIRRAEDAFPKAIRENPCTGPVFVEGTDRGGLLRVDIEQVAVRDYAVMARPATQVFDVRAAGLLVRPDVVLPLAPSVGVIGVAPRGGDVPTSEAGDYGGSLDCPAIRAGCAVFLPVGCEGALLAAGGVNAVLGEGKVGGSGAAVASEVTMRARPVDSSVPTPCVETPRAVWFLASAPTLDECQERVVEKAALFLTGELGMRETDALAMMSLAGRLGVCQVVNVRKTMYFAMPKSVLVPLGLGDLPAFRRRG